MAPLALACVSAIWLGILTSISPCPLATNITAISFVAGRFTRAFGVLLCGLIYTLGRAITYLMLAVLITTGIFSMPGASNFLQTYMNKLLGPVLIIVGMFLLELINLKFNTVPSSEKLQSFAKRNSLSGAALLGVVFALSFCPVSAALFFGSLLCLSVKYHSPILLPLLYGIGTALPVLLFAFVIAISTKAVGAFFNKLTLIEKWARRVTGTIFILAGLYYCLSYIFGLF
ncbi:MAG: aromatic aminobenezylarsenical efflux permease ArsG family transporter [Planctomycetota bacterium]